MKIIDYYDDNGRGTTQVVTQVPISTLGYDVEFRDFSGPNLKNCIEEYVEKKSYGVSCPRFLVNPKTQKIVLNPKFYGVIVIHFPASTSFHHDFGVDVYVNPKGEFLTKPYIRGESESQVKLTDDDKKYIKSIVKKVIGENSEFVAKQEEWVGKVQNFIDTIDQMTLLQAEQYLKKF